MGCVSSCSTYDSYLESVVDPNVSGYLRNPAAGPVVSVVYRYTLV